MSATKKKKETIMGKIGLSKSPQWLLSLGRNIEEEQDIYMAFKCPPLDCLLIARKKKETVSIQEKKFLGDRN